jgi:hypothetical protein
MYVLSIEGMLSPVNVFTYPVENTYLIGIALRGLHAAGKIKHIILWPEPFDESYSRGGLLNVSVPQRRDCGDPERWVKHFIALVQGWHGMPMEVA